MQLLENGLSFLWEEFMASSLLNKIKFLIGYVAKLHSKCAFQIFDGCSRKYLNLALSRRRSALQVDDQMGPTS